MEQINIQTVTLTFQHSIGEIFQYPFDQIKNVVPEDVFSYLSSFNSSVSNSLRSFSNWIFSNEQRIRRLGPNYIVVNGVIEITKELRKEIDRVENALITVSK